MTIFFKKQLTLISLLLLLSSTGIATGHARTTETIVAHWQSMQPIQGRMLVMIPEEVEQYVYTFSHKGGRETRLPVGQQVTDLLEKLLRSAFSSTTFMPVPSEATAKEMNEEQDPRMRGYDFVAIPRITKVSHWDRGPEYGFDVDLSLEISSFSTRTVETISGHGESSTPESPVFTPAERLSTAVSYALDAVRDGIVTRQDAWSR
ncbi:MAG: hypothetical protein RBS57_02535 [Desulforhabdus sp.]|nr:hypothetical protein [Desulforhabdus sp.]